MSKNNRTAPFWTNPIEDSPLPNHVRFRNQQQAAVELAQAMKAISELQQIVEVLWNKVNSGCQNESTTTTADNAKDMSKADKTTSKNAQTAEADQSPLSEKQPRASSSKAKDGTTAAKQSD